MCTTFEEWSTRSSILPKNTVKPSVATSRSKRRYFNGLRVHLVRMSRRGEPVEFSLAAGSEADVKLLKDFPLVVPRRVDHLCPQRQHRLPLRGRAKRGRLAPQSPAQGEIQAGDGCMGGVLEQAHSPVHRDGFQ